MYVLSFNDLTLIQPLEMSLISNDNQRFIEEEETDDPIIYKIKE